MDRFALAARTKRQKSATAILHAAEQLIERDGYAATSVNAIAKEASVGLATLYSHHPTKASLANELFRRQLERESGGEESAPISPSDQREQLLTELRRLARTAARHPGTAQAVLQASSGPPTRAERAKAEEAGRSPIPSEVQLSRLIRRGQEFGTLRQDLDAAELARILTTVILDRVVARSHDDPEVVADLVASMFLTGIANDRRS
jgi:AcrR family transcriptional regulator